MYTPHTNKTISIKGSSYDRTLNEIFAASVTKKYMCVNKKAYSAYNAQPCNEELLRAQVVSNDITGVSFRYM